MELFKKAIKTQRKLKLNISGPSGSGKTYAALMLASKLGSRIAVVDTEHASASLYADKYNFDTASMNPPYSVEKFILSMKAAVEAKYEVLVIDSITHAWAGDGGILNRKELLDSRPGSNSYANWGKVTPLYNSLIESILAAPIHVITTMRSKMDYVLQENDKGKMAPVKVGLAPIFRDGAEYEFDCHLELSLDHFASVSKDRLNIFSVDPFILTDETASLISKHLQEG